MGKISHFSTLFSEKLSSVFLADFWICYSQITKLTENVKKLGGLQSHFFRNSVNFDPITTFQEKIISFNRFKFSELSEIDTFPSKSHNEVI